MPIHFTNTGRCPIDIANVQFIPGASLEIPDHFLAKVRKSPIVKSGILREGKLEIQDQNSIVNTKSDFNDLDLASVLDLIEKENDRVTLMKIGFKDVREEVKEAVKRKLEKK